MYHTEVVLQFVLYIIMLSGWLNIYKPTGITSFDVIRQLKRLLGKGVKIGHAGTLDPLAEGILPIALGHATKLISFAQNDQKTYECTIQWGIQTDTDDVTGKTIYTSDIRPKVDQVQSILPEFMGEINQMPPIYSALKIEGKAAYAYAREGKTVNLASRMVKIYDIAMIHHDLSTGDTILKISCGKGTYIRSIARDMGVRLGTYGTIKTLKRTQVGRFTQESAINIFDFEQNQAIIEQILGMDYVLDDILAYPLSTEEWQHIAHGRPINCALQGEVVLRYNGDVVALGQGDGSMLRPHKVFKE